MLGSGWKQSSEVYVVERPAAGPCSTGCQAVTCISLSWSLMPILASSAAMTSLTSGIVKPKLGVSMVAVNPCGYADWAISCFALARLYG